MQKKIIGHIACQVCGHADADVKEDKNGHAFVFCSDCAAQTFTRNDFRDRKLRGRMRPVTVTVTEQPAPAVAPVSVPKPAEPAKPVQAAPTPAPPAAQKKTSWLTPLLAAGGQP